MLNFVSAPPAVTALNAGEGEAETKMPMAPASALRLSMRGSNGSAPPRFPRGSTVSSIPSCSGRGLGGSASTLTTPFVARDGGKLNGGGAATCRALKSAEPTGGSNGSGRRVLDRVSEEHSRVQEFLENLLSYEPSAPVVPAAVEAVGSFPAVHKGLQKPYGPPLGEEGFYVTLDEKPASQNLFGEDSDDADRKARDYYANLGYAIRTLREDIPILFMKDLNYDIYRDDVVFKDPRNTFKGIDKYKLIFWSLRFHGRIFFRHVFVEIKRLWQIDDKCIRMRWTVHGFPRVPWEAEGTFDGVSEFKLDREGKIYSHSVNNVIFRDPPGERLPLFARLSLTPFNEPVPNGGWCTFTEGDMQSLLLRAYLASILTAPKSHPLDVDMESSA